MADRQRGEDEAADTADQTVVMSTVVWPSTEPDSPMPPSGHVDYLDTPDGPVQAPPGGVYTPEPKPDSDPKPDADPRPAADTVPVAAGTPPAAVDPAADPPARSAAPRPAQPSAPVNPSPVAATQPMATRSPAAPPRAQGLAARPRPLRREPDGPPTEWLGKPIRPSDPPPPGHVRQPEPVRAAEPARPVEPVTTVHPVVAHQEPVARQKPAGGAPSLLQRLRGVRLSRRSLLVAAGVVGLLVLLYGLDLALGSGDVPRGVTVAGVKVGGLDRAHAEQRLHDEVDPRLAKPVAVRAGDVDAEVNPTEAGLELDWSATLDRAGDQPLNPWTRLRSLFAEREVGTVTRTDQAQLTSAVESLRATVDHEPVEGTVRFDGVSAVPVNPRPGQSLDAPAAAQALVAGWAGGRAVELPVNTTAVRSTEQSVRTALETIAQPAVSGPVTVTGEGAQATLTPEVIATALTFEVGQDGALNPKYDNEKITQALRPQLASTEQPGKDATVVIEAAGPVVKPSADGRGVDWEKSLATLPDVLRGTGDRTVAAVYGHQPAQFTTEAANGLGIRELVGEFTTKGFAADSGVNIRVLAAEVDGALVKAGETFSLNKFTGPRGTAQGYVEAGIIENGRPGRAVGGGCSQFATTLYNASYFAGLTDVAHKEHSYFISRYPEAREATVFEGVIDLAFRNDSPTGVLIQTIWTPSSITVKIWGTKHYEVESVTGARSDFTTPNTVTIPFGEKCSAGQGAQGFTVSNTRIVRDARTKAEVKRSTRTAVYNPIPKIVCGPAPGTEPVPPPAGG